MLSLWLADYEAEDHALKRSQTVGDGDTPFLVSEARDLSARLEETRARDLDVLEPDLVGAIDDFRWRAEQALQRCAFVEHGFSKDPERDRQVAAHLVVEQMSDLVGVLARYAPDQLLIDDGLRKLMNERIEQRRSQSIPAANSIT